MVARLALIPIELAAASLAASCGDDADDANCKALKRQTFDTLDEVIRASQGPCAKNSDCTIIGHASACHDSCSQVVLGSSLEAISATHAAIDANQCREFSRAECRLEIPPCVAPGTPSASTASAARRTNAFASARDGHTLHVV